MCGKRYYLKIKTTFPAVNTLLWTRVPRAEKYMLVGRSLKTTVLNRKSALCLTQHRHARPHVIMSTWGPSPQFAFFQEKQSSKTRNGWSWVIGIVSRLRLQIDKPNSNVLFVFVTIRFSWFVLGDVKPQNTLKNPGHNRGLIWERIRTEQANKAVPCLCGLHTSFVCLPKTTG